MALRFDGGVVLGADMRSAGGMECCLSVGTKTAQGFDERGMGLLLSPSEWNVETDEVVLVCGWNCKLCLW